MYEERESWEEKVPMMLGDTIVEWVDEYEKLASSITNDWRIDENFAEKYLKFFKTVEIEQSFIGPMLLPGVSGQRYGL
jgi:hypothetical protein